MPRNMSFSMTAAQIRNRTKTVTRRNGWENLKIGEVLRAIVKGQGLKKGEKVERLCDIRVVDVRREPLNRLSRYVIYGLTELQREGFPDMTPDEFVAMYCKANGCAPDKTITRIEFEYLYGLCTRTGVRRSHWTCDWHLVIRMAVGISGQG